MIYLPNSYILAHNDWFTRLHFYARTSLQFDYYDDFVRINFSEDSNDFMPKELYVAPLTLAQWAENAEVSYRTILKIKSSCLKEFAAEPLYLTLTDDEVKTLLGAAKLYSNTARGRNSFVKILLYLWMSIAACDGHYGCDRETLVKVLGVSRNTLADVVACAQKLRLIKTTQWNVAKGIARQFTWGEDAGRG